MPRNLNSCVQIQLCAMEVYLLLPSRIFKSVQVGDGDVCFSAPFRGPQKKRPLVPTKPQKLQKFLQEKHRRNHFMMEEEFQNGLMTDPSKLRRPPIDFKCGEELEEGLIGRSGVSFFCTLPTKIGADENTNTKTSDNDRLWFSCRDRSSGVLESQESAITNDQFEATQNATAVDPFFFDAGE